MARVKHKSFLNSLPQCPVKAMEEPGMVASGEFVLPNPQDAPAGTAQGAVDQLVARFVRGKFPTPERAVVFGLGGVLWAAVPETAVHENGKAHLAENEVGFAK
jgi:hypothetical protein